MPDGYCTPYSNSIRSTTTNNYVQSTPYMLLYQINLTLDKVTGSGLLG